MISRYFQHTLAVNLTFVGRGLHSGLPVRMTLQPAAPDNGIIFIRRDVPLFQSEIAARWYNVTDTRLSTTISNRFGAKVSTIEHLMAALYVCGIDNARIVLDGPEVPIMDGSAEPFVRMIQQAGTLQQNTERRAIVIRHQVQVEEHGKSASFLPAPVPRIDMTIDFDNAAIGHQELSVPLDRDLLAFDVSAARTFGFQEQIDTLRKLGLAKGGSLQNAVLIGDKGVINQEGLRFEDEFVRHKVLDAVGDLSLAGMIIIGRFMGMCSGHDLNNQVLRQLLAQEDAWFLTTLSGAEEYWAWTQGALQNRENRNDQAAI
ncbi:UDP-3-O-acyl-N-acetylglucosamine deacetylase [Thioalkalivibrio sp.]|uniref:UDP-3-O-acyl-N-acetylglucosamine deacetylase n=1 Tax=Thioalkalivibrio sp. TaxID=2093813 RepID=UPI00356352F5